MAKLNQEGLKPQFHQLDIDDHGSVERLRDYLKKTYGGLDILINNAGIAFKIASTEPFAHQATVTMATNYTATMDTCRILTPLIKPHGRVVNVASGAGKMSYDKMSEELKARFRAVKTEEEVAHLMEEFVKLAHQGTNEEKGWSNWAYGVSKLGLVCATKMFAENFQSGTPDQGILITAVSSTTFLFLN